MLTLDNRRAAQFHIRRRTTLHGNAEPQSKKRATNHFEDDHSLQATHDKTHPIC
jgi:glutamate decarboxylase